MKQKLLALLLIALLMPTSMWAALAVGDYFDDGLLKFKVTSISPNEVSFCGFTKVTDIEGVFTIPSSAKDTDGNSYSVKTIENYAFNSANIANMTGVVIPESITNIGNGAFYNCKGLTTITIPSHVTEIGEAAFYKCTNLKSIELPEGVISIGKLAFCECASLSKISIPSSVTSIGENAFEDCSSLTDISFPRGVKNLALENGAFYKCTGLKNFTIPEGVKSIGTGAFASCTNLESVTIPKGVTECGNGIFLYCTSLKTVVCASNPGNATCFDKCTALTNVTFTDDVTVIPGATFQGCSGLKSIKIPSSVTSIGDLAFSGCTSLTEITLPDGLEKIDKQAFWKCSSLKSIVIPSTVKEIGSSAFRYCDALTAIYIDLDSWCRMSFEFGSVAKEDWYKVLYLDRIKATDITNLVIPEGITKLKDNLFVSWANLKSVTFPSSMTDFSSVNFSDCNALSAINIQDLKAWLNTNFGGSGNPLAKAKHLFVKGKEVTDLVIPEGISAINDYAFYGCEGLTSVTIPQGVTSIGSNAFYKCTGLTNVTIPQSVTSIGTHAFDGCTGLTAVHISDISAWCGINFRGNPLSIAGHLFMNGKEVTDLAIPEGVTSISANAFSGCYFNSVSIPSSLRTIGGRAFSSGTNTVYLKDLATWCKIGVGCNLMNNCEHLFINGEEVTDLVIPDGVTSISDSVFYNCKAIASVNTGNTVKEIGSYSFARCDNLKNVTLGSSVTSIEEGAFYNCKELKEVYSYPEEPPFKTSTPYMWTVWYLAGEDNDRYNRTLYVPTGTKAKYVANGWNKYFNNIEEMRNTFTLTYMVDGEEYKSVEVDLGAAITPEAEPTKEGYTFSGWSEVPEMMPANDVTVTGTFAINKYTLTYKVDNEKYKSYEMEYGAAIRPEAEPAKEGYTFSGWSEIPETMPANDVTVTGTFAINKYTLTYKVDGEDYKSFDVEYGAAIRPEAEPTKEGYTFSGWSEIPETMPANDVTIIGSFTEDPVVIDIEPVEAEESIDVNNLDGQELSDNVVGNVYYNVGDGGYDSTDKSIVISQPTNMGQIADKEPGSKDVKENFNGMILKVAKGKGLIKVNVKTSGNAQLVVQVGNGTPMLASKTEKGDVVFRYDVEEDTYVYIYAIIGSSAAKGFGINATDTDSSVRIYSITVSPGATGIRSIEGRSATNDDTIYDLQGRRVKNTAKGVYIVGGRKYSVK